MKFKNGAFAHNVKNVGELIDSLKQLDPNTPTKQGFADSVDVVIYNSEFENRHIGFDDGGSWVDIENEKIDSSTKMEKLWEKSAQRIAEIDRLEDKYGYFMDSSARAKMPMHIEQKLERLHEEQSKFESEHA